MYYIFVVVAYWEPKVAGAALHFAILPRPLNAKTVGPPIGWILDVTTMVQDAIDMKFNILSKSTFEVLIREIT